LIKWFAPYIPALKGRALRCFFGKWMLIILAFLVVAG